MQFVRYQNTFFHRLCASNACEQFIQQQQVGYTKNNNTDKKKKPKIPKISNDQILILIFVFLRVWYTLLCNVLSSINSGSIIIIFFSNMIKKCSNINVTSSNKPRSTFVDCSSRPSTTIKNIFKNISPKRVYRTILLGIARALNVAVIIKHPQSV